MENRNYYIVKIPNPNSKVQNALDVSIGDNNTQRYSLDGSMVIIKTTPQRVSKKEKEGMSFNKIFPKGLTTKITYKKALALMKTSEWSEQTEEL